MLKVIEAKSFFQRLIGLLARQELGEEEMLLIKNCRSIHTLFMRFSIDVIMTDRKGIIVKLRQDLRPWRFCAGPLVVRDVYEASPGFIERFHLKPGDDFMRVLQREVP